MYTIKYGSKVLNDLFSKNNSVLHDISLTQNKNEFAYLDFTMELTHPLYNEIRMHDYTNIIQVLDNRDVIFAGYIYETETDFDLAKTIKCKDVMSYLSDSIVRPYSTKDGVLPRAPSSPISFFKYLLDEHNSMVPANQKIHPGNIGIINDSGYIDSKNMDYPSTFDEIMNKVVNVYGGYLKTRCEKGIYFLDYLHETTDSTDSMLDFGESILDITQTVNSEDLFTYILPTGATKKQCYDENGSSYDYVDGYFITKDTIPNIKKEYYILGEKKHDFSKWEWKSVFDKTEEGLPITYYEYNPENDESEIPITMKKINGVYNGVIYDDIYLEGDIIYKRSLVDKYGFIGKHVSNTDSTTVQMLELFGLQEMLMALEPSINVSIKAIDLKIIGGKPIGIGDHVRIRSKKHNIDRFFECVEINIDMSSPENTTYQFGVSLDTLTNTMEYLTDKINKHWDEA